MGYKLKASFGLQEAMDNLAAIEEIDMESPPPLGIVKGRRIVTGEEEFPKGSVEWLSGEGSEVVLELLDATYRGIRAHLQDLYQNAETDWESEKLKKGTAAMMLLASESTHKMDRYFAYRLNRPLEHPIHEREAFRSLQQFYTQRFLKKFSSEEGLEEEPVFFDESKGIFKDFESIRSDREYELFYIRNEEGVPYFHPDLFRELKLTVDLGDEGEFEEDPLLKVRAIQDRDLHASAEQILHECHPLIEDFFKLSRQFPESEVISLLNMALMALYLAVNPRHLVQNTIGKSCLEYFVDFLQFLRRALRTSEYQKWIAYAPDPNLKSVFSLLHLLCRSFFHRAGGVRQEVVGLLHRCMRKGGEEKKKKSLKKETLWNQMLLEDEHLRTWMAHFPNGPFFKTLDLVREGEEKDQLIPFDPIGQGNLPSRLYEVSIAGTSTEVLRMACPTTQAFINKAEVVEEFRAFLRSLGKGQVHLIIHLQDRTSWREGARSRTLEMLSKNAEFNHCLHVMTLPKDTDFYYQSSEYVHLHDAKLFLEAFEQQLASPDENGFFLDKEWIVFAQALLPLVHRHLFDAKESLTRQNREDFIEIVYQLLILRSVAQLKPVSMSFTCKDSLDTGAAASACFYGLAKLATGNLVDEVDFLRWLLYAPALFVRERAVDAERLMRVLSALQHIEVHRKELSKFLDYKELKIIPVRSER